MGLENIVWKFENKCVKGTEQLNLGVSHPFSFFINIYRKMENFRVVQCSRYFAVRREPRN